MIFFSKNQRYALATLVFACVYLIASLFVADGFYSDPVGPKIWLVGIALAIISLSILLFFAKPQDKTEGFPNISQWKIRLNFIGSIFVYTIILPYLGFALATIPLIFNICLIFKASKKAAFISSILMCAGAYLIFTVGLDIALAKGSWWR